MEKRFPFSKADFGSETHHSFDHLSYEFFALFLQSSTGIKALFISSPKVRRKAKGLLRQLMSKDLLHCFDQLKARMQQFGGVVEDRCIKEESN